MLYFLAEHFAKLEFLKSIYLRAFLAFVISFCIVLFVGKPFIKYLKVKKFGEEIRDDGPSSHFSKKGTPTMGGVLIIAAILLTSLFINDLKNPLILLVLLSTIMFAAIGFIDDYKKVVKKNTDGLSPKAKMAGLLIISIAYVILLITVFHNGTDIYVPIIDKYITLPIWLYIVFAVLVILATTNAVNLTDRNRWIINRCNNNNNSNINNNFNNVEY